MAAIDLQSSIYGRIWVVVDNTMEAGAESVEDQKKQDGPRLRLLDFTAADAGSGMG